MLLYQMRVRVSHWMEGVDVELTYVIAQSLM